VSDYHIGKENAIQVFEKKWLVGMAVLHDCNMSAMARCGGLDRTTLYRLMRKHELTRTDLLRMITPGSFSETE
jgi:transcriptional regulator of acetoin/glycerol metabolism